MWLGNLYISHPRKQLLFFCSHSQISQQAKARDYLTAIQQPKIEHTAISKLVYFKLLNFSWTSTSPHTYKHSYSISRQTLRCYVFFSSYPYIHTYTYIHVSKTCSLITPFVLTAKIRTHTYFEQHSLPFQLKYFSYTHPHIEMSNKHFRTLVLCIKSSLFALFYKKCLFSILVVVTFLLSALCILFVLLIEEPTLEVLLPTKPREQTHHSEGSDHRRFVSVKSGSMFSLFLFFCLLWCGVVWFIVIVVVVDVFWYLYL